MHRAAATRLRIRNDRVSKGGRHACEAGNDGGEGSGPDPDDYPNGFNTIHGKGFK